MAELLVRIPQNKGFSSPKETSQQDTGDQMKARPADPLLFFSLNHFIEVQWTYEKLYII